MKGSSSHPNRTHGTGHQTEAFPRGNCSAVLPWLQPPPLGPGHYSPSLKSHSFVMGDFLSSPSSRTTAPLPAGHSRIRPSLPHPRHPDQGQWHPVVSARTVRGGACLGVAATGLGPGLASLSLQARPSTRPHCILYTCEAHQAGDKAPVFTRSAPRCPPSASLGLHVTICKVGVTVSNP